jgi:hypothetical protein
MGMKKVLEMEKDEYDAFSFRCAAKARELFSEQREISEYEQLFKELISNNHG